MRGHCIELWRWSLGCSEDAKMLKIPELWGICQRCCMWRWKHPKEKCMFWAAKVEGQSHLGPLKPKSRYQTWSYKIWCLPFWVLVLLRPSISSLCQFPPFWNGIYILCHSMLEVHNLCFCFIVVTVKRLFWDLRETELLNSVEAVKGLGNILKWYWTNIILYHEMASTLWGQGAKYGGLNKCINLNMYLSIIASCIWTFDSSWWCCLGGYGTFRTSKYIMGGGLHKFIDSSTAVPSLFPDMPAKCDQPASCSGHLLPCFPTIVAAKPLES